MKIAVQHQTNPSHYEQYDTRYENLSFMCEGRDGERKMSYDGL
jgi:hypothetical protein